MTKKSKKTYEERLRIPTSGDQNRRLFTKSGKLLVLGYKRIVIGDRGPYVECALDQLNNEILCEVADRHYYYVELRSSDPDNVKVYVQLKRVNYADYEPGLCYISPFELNDAEGVPLIDRLY